MTDTLRAKAADYASRNGLQLGPNLGWGIHGSVWLVGNRFMALKCHYAWAPYCRERDCYIRLTQSGVFEISGLNVPQLVRWDDAYQIILMTVVAAPFILDFAGAFLDERPGFSEEIWDQWESDLREKFSDDWKRVRGILRELEIDHDIHMVDVHPGNLRL